MRHGVRIPSFGQHGNRNDQPNILPQFSLLAYAVYHLSQDISIGKRIGTSGTMQNGIFLFELLNLIRKNFLKFIIHNRPGFIDGDAVNKKRRLPFYRHTVSVIGENFKMPVYIHRIAFTVYRLITGHVFEHFL